LYTGTRTVGNIVTGFFFLQKSGVGTGTVTGTRTGIPSKRKLYLAVVGFL
jgi:hypothetical protein